MSEVERAADQKGRAPVVSRGPDRKRPRHQACCRCREYPTHPRHHRQAATQSEPLRAAKDRRDTKARLGSFSGPEGCRSASKRVGRGSGAGRRRRFPRSGGVVGRAPPVVIRGANSQPSKSGRGSRSKSTGFLSYSLRKRGRRLGRKLVDTWGPASSNRVASTAIKSAGCGSTSGRC